MLSFVLLTITT